MRLRRLDLSRYGKFTGRSLDFGAKPDSGPDLHLVYGLNEAGKSTTISAWLDLLYGIETRSTYNFLHDYPAMLIGASVEMDGGARELRRVKKNSGSLRDEHDASLPESVVLGPLGGIERAAYCTMFSLDDESLEKGGNAILASKGELGQLLFSASAGLADLSAQLGAVGAKADLFHKAQSRSSELAQLKTDLGRLRQERDAIDVVASRYAALVKERDKSRSDYEEAQHLRDSVQADLLRDQKLLSTLPEWIACRRKTLERADHVRHPPFPAAWAGMLPVLQRDEPALAAETASLDTALATLNEELERLSESPEWLALAPSIADARFLRGRFVTAVQDMPDRRARLQTANGKVVDLLARLGCSNRDPADLRLDPVMERTVRRLAESYSGIVARREAAHREYTEEQHTFAGMKDTLPDLTGALAAPSEAWAVLEACVAELDRSDHDTRYRLAMQQREAASQNLATLMRAVAPWQGDWSALAALPVPDDGEIERLRKACDAADQAVSTLETALQRLATERAGFVAKITAAAKADGLVTDAELGALRTEREQAWAAHRAALDGRTADAFEERMRRDDLAKDQRVAHADRVGGLRELVLSEAQKAAEIAALETELSRAQAERTKRHAALSFCLKTLGLPEDLPAQALVDFAQARRRGLEAWEMTRRHEAEAATAAADGEVHRTDLSQALALCGMARDDDVSLANLRRMAGARLETHKANLDLRQQFETQAKQVEGRAKALEDAREAEALWRREWTEACSACWFGSMDQLPESSDWGDLHSALVELDRAVLDRDELADRVAAMERDQTAFRAQVAALLADAGEGDAQADAVAAFDALDRRITVATESLTRRKEKEEARKVLIQHQSDLDLRLRTQQEACRPILEHFGVDTLAAAATAIAEAQTAERDARELADRIDQICAALSVPSMEEADALLDGLDSTLLAQAVLSKTEGLNATNAACEELAVRFREAAAALQAVDADAKVARLEEERQTILARIRDGAERWLRLSLGTAAARRALAIYREKHRGSMMDKASEAFAIISRNGYQGLTTQPADKEEILLAVDAEGRSKQATALSKGTRFQLYLALRVAGYHEFAKARPPMPFIADDIMETFDDFRAEETFRLFAGMAEKGQVIYFTHHQHLVEIARAVCPTLRVHEL